MASRFSPFLLLFFSLAMSNVVAELILEDGYTVTTLIDGYHLNINPYTVLPLPGSSDLVILDSSASTIYRVSFPISQDVGVKRISGSGTAGYSDGEPGSAQFKNPRSFAVDLAGNVYVADKANKVIRKISRSGVTTIAGGFSTKTGHDDGPAQNASFSSDFEVVFAPKKCALLIPDHGNKMVRQIDLKPDDCETGSSSKSAVGAVSVWILGLGISCLFGIVFGIAIRPYVIPDRSIPQFSGTWKHCLTNLVSIVLMLCFAIKSEVASTRLYALLRKLFFLCLHHLFLMFGTKPVGSQPSERNNNIDSELTIKELPSLIDSCVNSCLVNKSLVYADQMKELINFNDHGMELSNSENEMGMQGERNQEKSDVLVDGRGRIDRMMDDMIMGFLKAAKETTPLGEPSKGTEGLVKRRLR